MDGNINSSWAHFAYSTNGQHSSSSCKVTPPTKCNCWSKLDPQIWSWSGLYSFWDVAIFTFRRFGVKLLYSRPFWRVYVVTHRSNHEKAAPCAETRCCWWLYRVSAWVLLELQDDRRLVLPSYLSVTTSSCCPLEYRWCSQHISDLLVYHEHILQTDRILLALRHIQKIVFKPKWSHQCT